MRMWMRVRMGSMLELMELQRREGGRRIGGVAAAAAGMVTGMVTGAKTQTKRAMN